MTNIRSDIAGAINDAIYWERNVDGSRKMTGYGFLSSLVTDGLCRQGADKLWTPLHRCKIIVMDVQGAIRP